MKRDVEYLGLGVYDHPYSTNFKSSGRYVPLCSLHEVVEDIGWVAKVSNWPYQDKGAQSYNYISDFKATSFWTHGLLMTSKR